MKIKGFKISRRRTILLLTYAVMIMLTLVLNDTFSDFTHSHEADVANIKVADMNYNLVINGAQTTTLYVPANDETIANIIINSLNTVDSKYELIYGVCASEECSTLIQAPTELFVEYSSRTTDPITEVIKADEYKQVRLGITNNTSTGYYLKFGINAGYIHNTLTLEEQIVSEYNEEDITIAAIIDGEISTTFPTIKGEYQTEVTCTTNNGPSNATGTVSWNGSKWVVNITGVDTGRTICNVEFNDDRLFMQILAQGGGKTSIEAKGTPDFSVINGTSGLYAATDEYGTSYYYRGLKTELNNNLIWGGFQWKIVRINGDDSIRLVYNGTEAQFNTNGYANDTESNTQIKTAAWNKKYNDAKYVGYMYGGANGVASTVRHGTTWNAATYNETNSNIKTELDNWYASNIAGKSFEADIVDNLFCNDRQLRSEVGGTSTGSGYGTSETYYAASYRLDTNKSPTLKCGLKNDRFTKSDTTLGNGALTYPVGLLSADEAAMAGLVYNISNSTNYLYTNQNYWLFSPSHMNSSGYARAFYVNSAGLLRNDFVGNSGHGVRPAVSINSKTRVTGSGSNVDPYKVV